LKETAAAKISRLEADVAMYRGRWGDASVANDAAQKALKESRSHFAELKERLADAETNLARLTGYIERVREDDNARDGFDVVNQTREAIVPRRNPAKPVAASSIETGSWIGRAGGQRRRHWTDY